MPKSLPDKPQWLPSGDKQYVMSVTPLVRMASGGFGIFSMLLGLGLFFYKSKLSLLTINSIITTQVWGATFFIVGAIMIYALFSKKNVLMRQLMLVSLFLKSAWEIALLIGLKQYVYTALMFGFLLFLQALFYVYFFADKQKPL